MIILMRLIDADTLIETICHDCQHRCHEFRREVKHIINAPTVDAVPVAHLVDLLERWNWDCAMCTHSVDCDKCGLNRCINELKEIINSSTRKKGEHGATD